MKPESVEMSRDNKGVSSGEAVSSFASCWATFCCVKPKEQPVVIDVSRLEETWPHMISALSRV